MSGTNWKNSMEAEEDRTRSDILGRLDFIDFPYCFTCPFLSYCRIQHGRA